MDGNGQLRDDHAGAEVLRWPGRVLAADDLRRSLNGHREVVLSPRAVLTPLAEERLRADGIRVSRRPDQEQPVAPLRWGYAQDRPHPLVRTAVQALAREGLPLKELSGEEKGLTCRWAQALAACVARGDCCGGVVFCQDPGLVCCVANKVAGLRAAAVLTVAQAARATLSLGANLLAVEMPGRTFFEVRQILRTLCQPCDPACPPGLACTLKELEAHAHR